MSVPFDTDDQDTVVTGQGGTAPPPSDSAAGRFQLMGVIGEGGMATILEAEDTRLGRIVAVKRLKDVHAHDGDMRERFEREARILGGLAHPGLVPVYEAGHLAGGDLYFAMQRISGKTLAEIMRGRSESQVRDRSMMLRLVDIYERICLAIAYAHGRRILHRDIKPANVMVDDEFGVVYVMDWGLAKHLPEPGARDEPTMAGVVMGTPGYMSPEQLKGLAESEDCRTDVFALGVILYEILTGERPFRGELMDLVKETAQHDPPAPASINPRCGRELSAICMKALAKNPDLRYPTAKELADDIRRYREFLPVSVVKPRLVDRAANWARRNRALAGAVAALLFALLALGAWIGIAAWTRQRTIAWAMGLVAESQQEVAALETKIDAVKDQLTRTEDPAQQQALEETLAELRGDYLSRHLELRGRLSGVIGYTFPSPDPRAMEMSRETIFAIARRGMEAGAYALVLAHVTSTLENYERRNILGFTAEQVDELKAILKEARTRAHAEAQARKASLPE